MFNFKSVKDKGNKYLIPTCHITGPAATATAKTVATKLLAPISSLGYFTNNVAVRIQKHNIKPTNTVKFESPFQFEGVKVQK